MTETQTQDEVQAGAMTPEEVKRMRRELETGSFKFISYLIQPIMIGGRSQRREYSQRLTLTLAKAEEILKHYGAMPKFVSAQAV